MREIKFRAWDKRANVMLYPNKDNPTWVLLKHKEMFDIIKLMQFTGLKDKNGKEIFEGDIVKVDEHYNIYDAKYPEHILKVEFFEGGFNLMHLQLPNEFIFDLHSEVINERVEVIGNIYDENPKLLSKSKAREKK